MSDRFHEIDGEELEEELEEGDDLEAMEISRLLQLHDLLYKMKMEVMISEYKEEPILRIWPKVGNEELDCYLRYHAWNLDKGIFLLEAFVPMAPCPEDEMETLIQCMKYNQESLVGTLYPEEGRLYLRMVYREAGIPIDEERMQEFLKDLVEEWEYLQL